MAKREMLQLKLKNLSPESLRYNCIRLDGQKKGPSSLRFLDQLKKLKSPSSEYKVCKACDSEKNAIPLDAVVLFSENQKSDLVIIYHISV